MCQVGRSIDWVGGSGFGPSWSGCGAWTCGHRVVDACAHMRAGAAVVCIVLLCVGRADEGGLEIDKIE